MFDEHGHCAFKIDFTAGHKPVVSEPSDHETKVESSGCDFRPTPDTESINGVLLGKIDNVLNLPANDVYIVLNKDKEILIPAIKDCVKKVDIKNSVMIIHPIDGLLE